MLRSIEDALVRPPRSVPHAASDLGPVVLERPAGQELLRREEVQLRNDRGQVLAVSFLRPTVRWSGAWGTRRNRSRAWQRVAMPCVVFAHPNASNRAEGLQLRSWAAAAGCCVCSFDFAGCGESDGDTITLGRRERDDLRTVLEWVLQQDTVTEVLLAGRSMGAVAALLVASEPDADLAFLGRLKGVIADSPFASIRALCLDHASRSKLLRVAAKLGMGYLRRRLRRRTGGCDLFDPALEPVAAVTRASVPVLFVSATQDEICFAAHQQQLFAAYGGQDKQLVECGGGHNDCRPAAVWDAMTLFVHKCLAPPMEPVLLGSLDATVCSCTPFIVLNGDFVNDLRCA